MSVRSPPSRTFNVQRSLKDWPSADERISSAAPDQGISICRDGRVIDLHVTCAPSLLGCARVALLHPTSPATFTLTTHGSILRVHGETRLWPLKAFFGSRSLN